MAGVKETILEQTDESSREAGITNLKPQKLSYDPPFSLSKFDIEMWTRDKQSSNKPFYFSPESADCLFQFSYYSNTGLLLQDSADRAFLTGWWKTIDLQSILQGVKPTNSVRFASLPSTETDGLVLSPEKMYPDTENFLELDYTELESYVDSSPESCIGPLAKVFIARKNKDPAWGRLAKLYHKYCPQVAAVWMRILAANIQTSTSAEMSAGWAAELIQAFTYSLLHSGLFYFTKENRADVRSTLGFVFGVILDTVPIVRALSLEMIRPASALFDKDSYDLFAIEADVWRDESLLDKILLYMFMETDRSCPVYQKAKYFMEHFVLSQNHKAKYGLIVADFYEFDSALSKSDDPVYHQKIIEFYTQAYKSSNEFVSMNALSRLAIIYQRRWRKMMANPSSTVTNQMITEEYNSLLEVHRVLAKVDRFESMEFLLNHYYLCHSFSVGELDNMRRPQRDIDNLIGNRRVSLELCKPYFNYFYVIGQKAPYLEDYFRVLHYLGYIEAGLVALRYGTMMQKDECTLAKRVYYYALCKAEGLGIDFDPVYAGQVFYRIFLDEAERLSDNNLLEVVIQLYHLVQLTPNVENEVSTIKSMLFGKMPDPVTKKQSSKPIKTKADLRLELAEELVNLISQVSEFKDRKPSKKFLYYSVQVLKAWKSLRKPQGNSDLKIERLLVQLIQKAFFTDYQSAEDHYYQYLLEAEISQSLCSFQSITQVAEDKKYSSHLDGFRCVKAETDLAAVTEVVDLLTLLFNSVPRQQDSEISRYHLLEHVKEKADGVLKTIVGEGKPDQQSPTQRKSSRKGSIVRPSFEVSATQPAPARRQGSKKKLSLVSKKEMELKLGTHQTVAMMTSLDLIGSQISVLSLMSDFKARFIKEGGGLRLFSEHELEEMHSEDVRPLHGVVPVRKMKFKRNNQLCRVFELEFSSTQDCDDFYEQLHFGATWSVYFLNYYGVFLYENLTSSTSFKVGLVAEPFDRFAMASSNSSSVWAEPEFTLQDKCIMFLDLLAAVRQLQTARIPHLMLCPSYCAVYRGADNTPHLKVMIPFFLSVWSAPEEHLQRPSPLEDLLYLPPHIYVLKTYPTERQLPLIIDPSDTKTATILNADAWSLAVTFITLTQSSRFLSVSSELDTSEEYIRLLSRKSTLSQALEDQLSWWKKNFKHRRVPFHELQRMLSLKPQQRLGLSKSLEFLEMFVKKELLGDGAGGQAAGADGAEPGQTGEGAQANLGLNLSNPDSRPKGLFGSGAFSPLTSALMNLAKSVHPTWSPSGKDGFAGVDMPAWGKDLRSDAESGEVILPLGLEYIGGLKFNEGRLKVMPHGTGSIRRGRRVILEGEFLSGMPSGKLIVHGDNAAKLELDVDEDKGVVKECCASWSDEKFLKEDIFDILTPIMRPGSEQTKLKDLESATRMMLINLDHLRSLFQDNEKRKMLQADLRNHLELDKLQKEELNNDLMSNLARMVLGEAMQVISADQNPKPALVKEQGGGLFDNFFKDEEWQDDEESQNDTGRGTGAPSVPKSKLVTSSRANLAKFGRPDVPLSQQSYDAQLQLLTNYIDRLRQGAHMFCPPGYTIVENQRSPGKRKSKGPLNLKNMFNIVGTVLASPFAQEKEKKLVRSWDPFGYEYILWQDEFEDGPDVSLGLLRRPVGYENYLSTVVFLPTVSNYIFFETDVFRHRLVDTLAPVTTLQKLTNAAKKSGFVVETDLTGEQRAVKMIEGRVSSGTAISVRTNRSILYKEERTTDVAFGSLYLKDDDFIYQGEIQSGMMCGDGKLRSAKNSDPHFYQGEFRDDLPHGTGIFTESTGEVFTGSFYHGVRVIGILNGNKSNTREGLFIPKKQVEADLSPLRQAVRINQGSAIVVGRMTIPDKLVCFGVLQDSIAQSTGFFKVKYPSGDQYQGYFNCGRRFGPFVLTAPEGDILIGKWLLQEDDTSVDKYCLQGIVLWNDSSSRQFSKGIFKLNSRGEIEQGQYGIIKNRDGSIYTGEIYNNKYEGAGKLKLSDSSYYEGYFRDGMYHGWGERYTASTKTTFKGQFDHGVIQGFGILSSKKAVIKGYFMDGVCQIAYREDFQMKLDGKDVRSLVARTIQYQEAGVDGYDMDGVCRAILGDGDYVFEGDIRMGKIEGRGVLYRAEELVYEGLFKNGFYHIGRLVVHPKVIFSGEFDRSNPTCPGIKKDRDLVIEGTFQHGINSDGKLEPIMNSICLVYNKLLKELKVGYFKDGRERDCFLVKKEMGRAGENSNSAGNQRGLNMAARRNMIDGGGIYARNKGGLMPITAPLFRLEFYDHGVLESSKDFPPHQTFSI